MNTVQPIRNPKQLEEFKQQLRGMNFKYWLAFVVGSNCALRVSDLRVIKVHQLFDENRKVKQFIQIREQKRGKERQIKVNKALRAALKEYMELYNPTMQDYVFESPKPNAQGQNQPYLRQTIGDAYKAAAEAVHIKEPVGTHTARKQFGYNLRKYHGVSLAVLRAVYNHDSEADTARYIGVTQEEIHDVYDVANI